MGRRSLNDGRTEPFTSDMFDRPHSPRPRKRSYCYLFLIVLFLVVSGALLLWQIPTLPPTQVEMEPPARIFGYRDTQIVSFTDMEGCCHFGRGVIRRLRSLGFGMYPSSASPFDGVWGDGERLVVPPGTILVFHGDTVDRGTCGYELAALLANTKAAQPSQVVLILGNRDANKLTYVLVEDAVRTGNDLFLQRPYWDIPSDQNDWDAEWRRWLELLRGGQAMSRDGAEGFPGYSSRMWPSQVSQDGWELFHTGERPTDPVKYRTQVEPIAESLSGGVNGSASPYFRRLLWSQSTGMGLEMRKWRDTLCDTEIRRRAGASHRPCDLSNLARSLDESELVSRYIVSTVSSPTGPLHRYIAAAAFAWAANGVLYGHNGPIMVPKSHTSAHLAGFMEVPVMHALAHCADSGDCVTPADLGASLVPWEGGGGVDAWLSVLHVEGYASAAAALTAACRLDRPMRDSGLYARWWYLHRMGSTFGKVPSLVANNMDMDNFWTTMSLEPHDTVRLKQTGVRWLLLGHQPAGWAPRNSIDHLVFLDSTFSNGVPHADQRTNYGVAVRRGDVLRVTSYIGDGENKVGEVTLELRDDGPTVHAGMQRTCDGAEVDGVWYYLGKCEASGLHYYATTLSLFQTLYFRSVQDGHGVEGGPGVEWFDANLGVWADVSTSPAAAVPAPLCPNPKQSSSKSTH